MSNLSIPNTIANGNAADGNEVGANFSAVQTWANAEAVHKDGLVAMTGALTLAGNPASALQAAPKQYVDAGDAASAAALAAHKPAAKFTRTTDISLSPAAGSDVHFEAETGDQGGWWSSGNIVTVPAGIYAIAAACLSDGSGRTSMDLQCSSTGTVNALQSASGQNSTIHAGGVFYFPTSAIIFITVNEINGGASKTIRQVDLAICQLAAF